MFSLSTAVCVTRRIFLLTKGNLTHREQLATGGAGRPPWTAQTDSQVPAEAGQNEEGEIFQQDHGFLNM